MALPYLLLAAAPGTARLLPRPGAWMETVRGVMGFLLAAAAVWLFYVLAAQVSPERWRWSSSASCGSPCSPGCGTGGVGRGERAAARAAGGAGMAAAIVRHAGSRRPGPRPAAPAAAGPDAGGPA